MTTANAQTPTLNIDNQQYPIESLSNEAKAILANLQATDQELARLQMQQAICQTARNAYLHALRSALPSKS
jgi:hypothetical protein